MINVLAAVSPEVCTKLHSKAFIVASLSGALAFNAVNAQTPQVPDPGQLLKREIERVTVPQPERDIVTIDSTSEKAEPSELDSIRIVVRGFRFSGAEAIPIEQLQFLVSRFVGTELGFKGLQSVAQIVQAEYRKRGYPLAQALLPKQDITEGIVTIQVIEGRPSKGSSSLRIEPDGEFRVDGEVARRTVDQTLSRDAAMSEGNIERATLLLNDLTGMSAALALEPGDLPGSTRVVIRTKEVPRASGSLTADTAGGRLTGTERYGANLNLNTPWGLGEQFSASVLQSSDGAGEFNFHRLAYTMPLNGHGLTLNLAYSEASFKVGKELAQFQSSGTASTSTVGLRYPFVRSRKSNLYGTFSYDLKQSESFGDFSEPFGSPAQQSDKRSHVNSLGLSGDFVDGFGDGGFNNYGIVLSRGNIELSSIYPLDGSERSRDAGPGGKNVQGGFSKMSVNYRRAQALGRNSTLLLNLAYQRPFGEKNLDGSEKLSIGGTAGVRAYPGEGAGDTAYTAQVEFITSVSRNEWVKRSFENWTLPDLGDLSFLVFYDYGKTELNTISFDALNEYSLQGYGFGFILAKTSAYELRVYATGPIGRNPAASVEGNDSDGKPAGRRYAAFLTVPF